MQLLLVVGSYRKNGNTDQIIGLVREHLIDNARQQQVDLEIETVYLGRQKLEFCRGCRICFDRGAEFCPCQDDVPALKAKMEAADGLILASPVYVDDVSGLMKTLIDRLCHVCHRPQFAGKTAYLLATTGGTRAGKTLATMTLAVRTWGYHVVGQSAFAMGALMNREQSRVQFDAQAAQIAQKFFQATHRASYRNPSFLSLMMFKIQQMGWGAKLSDPIQQDTLDARYWVQQGWLDPARTFYITHTAGWLKVAAARLVGVVVGKIFA